MQSDMDFLEITFNTIDEGITIYDKDLKLVRWNKQYSSMGITPLDELYVGARLLDTYLRMAGAGVFGSGDPIELANTRIDALKNGPLIETEILNGASRRLIRINRSRLSNGGICAVFRDVTDERRAEVLARQSEKLKALGNLVGGLAHDMNNVLAIIIANLEIAQKNPLDASKSTEVALAAANSGTQLVQSLLAFARRQPLENTVVNVLEPLDKLCSMLSTLIGEKISVNRISEKDLWYVEIDVNQFESNMLNLIINARDSMPDGGELTITVSNIAVGVQKTKLMNMKPGEYVCVSIADTGVGMSVTTMEQAFDPFFTTKDAKVGTGLGLSMAHGFSKQSSGYINVNSELNVGTTVELYFPRTQSLLSDMESVSSETETTNNGMLTVLVVEDNEPLRVAIGKLICSLGYAAITVASAEKAMAYSEWDNIDILLTDLNMPDMDGFQLAENLLQEYSKLGVIYMTGNVEQAIESRGNLESDAMLLKKPFRLAELSTAIANVHARM